MAQGHLDRALTQYQSLSAQAPNAAGPLTMIAMIHEAKGDQASANASYARALVEDPRAGVAANNLAWAYAQEGRLDEALGLAKTAKAALAGRPEAEHTLGWVYLNSGEATEAVTAFERAVLHAPGKPTYHYHLGLAQVQAVQLNEPPFLYNRHSDLGCQAKMLRLHGTLCTVRFEIRPRGISRHV